MLAAHRDQENLVHSHQLPAKQQQQQKTPGARYPKTPSRFPQHDENVPTAFAGKTGLKGMAKAGGNENTISKGNGTRQALVTPLETRSRAALGNKTTNAKARTGQTGGAHGAAIKDIEKAQAKPTTLQRPKHKSTEVAPIKFQVRVEHEDIQEDEEPEYAPPKPKDIPYESDVLPRGLLTFEGLKDGNLLKGYYQHFYNPIDDEGVSKQDREYEEAMNKILAKAEAQNQREANELDWDTLGPADPLKPAPKKLASKEVPLERSKSQAHRAHAKYPPTITSRRAASALSMATDATKKPLTRPATQSMRPKRPLSSLLPSKRAVSDSMAERKSPFESAVGEAASRSTIGYKMGKSTSSMIRAAQGRSDSVRPERQGNAISLDGDLTVTPARMRQTARGTHMGDSRPQFMSIFDVNEDDDDDLPAMIGPLQLSEGESEDEDEFELRLDL